jgi:chromosome segregation ATPase
VLIVVLGGGAGFGGAKTQDKASDDAVAAAQADLARARKELQDATLELDTLGATTRKLRRDLDKAEGARESLAELVRSLEGKVKTLEGAKAAVILAAPDRPPASPH